MQDLVAGQIDLQIEPASNFFAQAKAGAIKPYAITAKNRSWPRRADIPTTDEAGHAGLPRSLWYGLWAPKDTPKDVDRAGSTPRCSRRWRTRRRASASPISAWRRRRASSRRRRRLRAFQKSEADKWWPVIKAANIKGQ